MKPFERFSVSVVIPNYNGKHLLEANLPSVIAALNYSQLTSEIIVVDDASRDDSVKFIQHRYPYVKLLVNEANQGFSPTINKGMFAAQYQLVLALNSDVQLSENYFEHQLRYFNTPETFGVMGKIVGADDLQLQDGAKCPKVSFKGIKTTYNYIADETPTAQFFPSFFLSGANALMDKNKVWDLGGFDELYAPFYYEDADLGVWAGNVILNPGPFVHMLFLLPSVNSNPKK
jgi:GT2 family glycosyltransferase